ncbi:MAG: hypothetical protein GTN78_26280 [Gemmatimonadales bacterium]|nr:hypothetical protein [Gemmatimonadales bacterium]
MVISKASEKPSLSVSARSQLVPRRITSWPSVRPSPSLSGSVSRQPLVISRERTRPSASSSGSPTVTNALTVAAAVEAAALAA